MLSDPLAVAASAPNPAYSYLRVKTDGYGAEYKDVASGTTLVINHEKSAKGDRHYLKISVPKDAVNPYTGLTTRQTMTASLTITMPPYGFTETEGVNFIKQMIDTLNDSDFTSARFLQFQS